jgi:RHS repeat-associated protein
MTVSPRAAAAAFAADTAPAAMRSRLAALLGTVLVGLAVLASTPATAQQVELERVVEFEYFPAGDARHGMLRTERVDPGRAECVQTSYELDGAGNRTRVTVAPCPGATAPDKSFPNRVTVNHYDAGTQHPASAYVTRTQVLSPSNAVMSEARASFDARFGAAISTTEVALANPARNITKRATYDALGRVAWEHVPVTRRADGSLEETHVQQRIVYCQGPHASSPVDAGCIAIPQITLPVTYASGRLTDLVGDNPDQAIIRLSSAYFVESTPRATADPNGPIVGARSRVHFDALHREFAKESQAYDGRWVRSLTGFDQLGATAITWSPHFSTGNTAPPEELRQWTHARDLLHRSTIGRNYNRDTEGQAPVIVETHVSYDGLRTATAEQGGTGVNAQSRGQTVIKNAAGQTAQTRNALGATLNSAYDGFGNLVETQDAFDNRTRIAYTANTARFKEAMQDPNRGNWSYKYDALGQLRTQIDGNGRAVQTEFDVLGRPLKKTARQSENGVVTHQSNWVYSVDANGTVQCADSAGLSRLCRAFSGNGDTDASPQLRFSDRSLAYDDFGRVWRVQEALGGVTYTSTTTFDARGRPSTLTYPSGLQVSYAYSAGAGGKTPGVLERVNDASGNAYWSIANVLQPYDAHGNLLQAQLAHGAMSTANVYDSVSGKALALRASSTGGTNNVLNQGYQYDRFNNLARRTNGFTAGQETFAYDRLNRLTSYSVDSPDNAADRTITTAYNALGNILHKSDVGGYEYSGTRPHAVSLAANTLYTYDGNGNVLFTNGAQVRNHTWTDFNLPATMSHNGATVQFTYDDELQRVYELTTTGSTVRRLWLLHPDNKGGLGFEREETQVNGSIVRNENRHFISVGGTVVAVVKTLNANTANNLTQNNPVNAATDANLTIYWHRDLLGSIVAVTRANGQVLERPAFDAWGRRLLDNGQTDPATSGPSHGDRGYTGHAHLDELGLIHMNGRVYDPVLARFLSPDPLIQDPSNLQNYNLYSYVLNNPLRYTDPAGEWWQVVAFVVGAVMAQEGNQYWRMVGQMLMMAGMTVGGGQGGLLTGANGLGSLTAGSKIAVSAWAAGFSTALTPGTSGADMAQSMAFAAAFAAIGASSIPDGPERIAAHALVGCVQGAMSGGKCGPSAMAAGFGKAVSTYMPGGLNNFELGVVTTIAGGTASVIGGGKFSSGALSAGMGYLFNYMSNKWLRATVPGQIQFDHGMTALEQGDPGKAAIHFGAMLAEQVAFAATLGTSGVSLQTTRSLLLDAANAPVGSALKEDAMHLAATFMREEAIKKGFLFRVTGGDGQSRLLIQYPGVMNNVAGRWEYLFQSGHLTHQRFVAGGKINGVPNKP